MNSGMAEFQEIPGVNYAFPYEDFFREQAGKSDDAATEAYRWQCENDLFFLMYFGLGKTYFHQPGTEHAYRWASWWVDRIRDVEEGRDDNILELWFRGSGKSQIRTVSETIQNILKDPSSTTVIFGNTGKLGTAFLREIKELLEQREILHRWYPDVLWGDAKACKRHSPLWSTQSGIIVKRKDARKECTVEAWGLTDNQPTGMHYDRGLYDDCVVRASVQTQAQIEKTSETYKLSLNLFAAKNKKIHIGTRYHFADLWGEFEDSVRLGDSDMEIRKYPIRTPDSGGYKYWFFTEAETLEKEVQQGQWVFSSQQLLQPVNPDRQKFTANHVTFWDKLPEGYMSKYLLGDLAGWDEDKKVAGKGDHSAFAVLGVTRGDGYDPWHLLEIKSGRLDPDEMIEHLFESYARWGWIWGKIEDGKEYRSLKFTLDKEMRLRGHRIPIDKLEHKGQSKDSRIMMLQPRWERHAILFKPEQQAAVAQFTQYPFAKYRDIIDALAYGEQYIPRRPKPRSKGPRRPKLTARNKRGGY